MSYKINLLKSNKKHSNFRSRDSDTLKTLCVRFSINKLLFLVDNKPFHVDNDDYALGAHLYNHGYSDKSDFSKIFKVCVLEVCSPKVLEVKEHMYIHKLNSLCPNGVNISNPFSIPVLNRF